MATPTPSSTAVRAGERATGQVARRTGSGLAALRLQSTGPLLILVVLCVGFGVLSSRFATVSNLHTVVDQAAVALVLATGLTFVVLLGSIDLSLEGVMGVSSITVSLLLANDVNGLDLGVAGVLLAVASGLVAGLASGLVHVVFRIPSLMVTIGSWFMALGVATLLFPGRQPHVQDHALTALASDRWLGFAKLDFIALAVLLVGLVLQRYTGFGRGVLAIGSSEEVARLSGVRVGRIKVAAFAFCGLTAALAGVMATAKLGVGNVQAGLGQLFPAVAAVVIGGTLLTGGRGGVAHTLVGVLILAVLGNGLILIGVDPYIQEGIQGLIIVAAVAAGTWTMRSRLRVVK